MFNINFGKKDKNSSSKEERKCFKDRINGQKVVKNSISISNLIKTKKLAVINDSSREVVNQIVPGYTNYYGGVGFKKSDDDNIYSIGLIESSDEEETTKHFAITSLVDGIEEVLAIISNEGVLMAGSFSVGDSGTVIYPDGSEQDEAYAGIPDDYKNQTYTKATITVDSSGKIVSLASGEECQEVTTPTLSDVLVSGNDAGEMHLVNVGGISLTGSIGYSDSTVQSTAYTGVPSSYLNNAVRPGRITFGGNGEIANINSLMVSMTNGTYTDNNFQDQGNGTYLLTGSSAEFTPPVYIYTPNKSLVAGNYYKFSATAIFFGGGVSSINYFYIGGIKIVDHNDSSIVFYQSNSFGNQYNTPQGVVFQTIALPTTIFASQHSTADYSGQFDVVFVLNYYMTCSTNTTELSIICNCVIDEI